MRKEKTLFTIGQFAALHEINKKTLMWYDEIGLLKPTALKENGYRFYSYEQSAQLETILMLRELGVSLPEIGQFMKNRTADSLETLMEEKIREVDQRISHLKSVREVLRHHKKDMETLRSLDLSAITLVERPGAYLAAVPVRPGASFEEEVTEVIAEARKYQLRRLHDASYGSMISAESLYQGNFHDYTEIYIELPLHHSKKGLHVKPAGTYLQAFCKGSWDRLPAKYGEILDFAKERGFTLYGHAYETGINDLVIDRIEDYITRIEIPVKEKSEK